MSGGQRQVEARVEADRGDPWRDPARIRDQFLRGNLDTGLLRELPDGRGAMGLLALAVVRVDRAAWEYPDARHEARLRVPLHEQDLQAPFGVLATPAQEDHRCRRTRG